MKEWIQQNKKLVTLVGGIVGAVAVLFGFGLWLHNTSRVYKQEKWLKAQMMKVPVVKKAAAWYHIPEPIETPRDVKELKQVVQDVAGSATGNRELIADLARENQALGQQNRRLHELVANNNELIAELQHKVLSLSADLATKEEIHALSEQTSQATKEMVSALDKKLQEAEKKLSVDVARKRASVMANKDVTYKKLSKIYSEMDADVIAEIFQEKELEQSQVVELLSLLPRDKVSEVLAAMDASTAAAYTRLLAERTM